MHTARRRSALAIALLAIALFLAACGGATGSTGTATSAPAAAPSAAASAAPSAAAGGGAATADAVTIQDFSFAPASITVKVGATVTWTNKDTAAHTVTADDGSFDSRSLSTDATFSQSFAKAGTYSYHCSIHSSMTATIVVQ